jgi:hypothetical protein
VGNSSWDDETGEPITPEPIDWAQWRPEHLPASALPPGLSRLQRERMEKKARKRTLRRWRDVEAIEASLHRERKLDRLDPKVLEALVNAVMRFVQARATTRTWGDLPGPHHHRAAAVWFQSVNRRLERSSSSHVT